MLVIASLWLILLILCLSNRTGLKLFAVASVVLWGAIFVTMIAALRVRRPHSAPPASSSPCAGRPDGANGRN